MFAEVQDDGWTAAEDHWVEVFVQDHALIQYNTTLLGGKNSGGKTPETTSLHPFSLQVKFVLGSDRA